VSKVKLFSVVRGTLWGCGVTILAFLPLPPLEVVLNLLGVDLNLKTYSWLIAVAVGGYFSCRQAKTTAWMNCLVFAVLAEIFVVSGIPDANKNLAQMYPNADVLWHYPTMLVLTIPAVLLGGIFWARRNKDKDRRLPDDKQTSDT
jgi:uncharacterized membrane protein